MIATILFSKKKQGIVIGSKLIMAVEGLPFSHAAIMLNVNGYDWVYESIHPESRVVSYDFWEQDYELVESYNFEIKESVSDVLDFLRPMTGIPYSLAQVFMVYAKIILKTVWRKIKRVKVNGNHGLICTELVGDFMNRFWRIKFRESSDMIDLRDVLQACVHLKLQEDHGNNDT